MKNSNETLLTITTGRGGRFNNAGYQKFRGTNKRIHDFLYEDDVYYDEETNVLRDSGGNELDFEINENGTGYIDIDGGYDYIAVSLASDLDADEFYIIARSNSFEKIEVLENLGVKNAKIFDVFDLLERACADKLYELGDWNIEIISEKELDIRTDDFYLEYQYERIDGKIYFRCLD